MRMKGGKYFKAKSDLIEEDIVPASQYENPEAVDFEDLPKWYRENMNEKEKQSLKKAFEHYIKVDCKGILPRRACTTTTKTVFA